MLLAQIPRTVSLALISIVGTVSADSIERVRVEGNHVTQQDVILNEVEIMPGERVDLDKISRSVQNIKDLNLFENVDYYLEQNGPDSGVEVVIPVMERRYFYVIPTAKTNDDNELEYGARLVWKNVNGLNHTLKLRLLDAGESAGQSQYKTEFRYVAPRVYGSDLTSIVDVRSHSLVDDDPILGLQSEDTDRLIVDMFRWLNDSGVSSGYFMSAGATFQQRTNESLVSPGMVSDSAQVAGLRARVGYERVHEYPYNRSGKKVEYLIEAVPRAWATDGDEYTRHHLDLRFYTPLKSYPPRNINYRISVGVSDNDVLDERAFDIGGNSKLRGYDSGVYRGNAQVITSIEYLTAFDSMLNFRGVLFMDMGAVAESLSELDELRSDIGIGLRWKVQRFVDMNIRLDSAYAFDTDEVRFALSANHTF